MNKSRLAVVFSLFAIVTLTMAGCATPTPQVIIQTQVVAQTEVPVIQTQVVVETAAPVIQTQVVQVTATPPPQAKPFVTWFQYDQGNVDPQSDERVGNDYLRKTMPLFNQAFAGKWDWQNEFTPFDRAIAKLVTAVQAKADVPDLVDGQSNYVNTFYKNGSVQDLTAWAQAQSWWSDMDPAAILSCKGPDGKLYCIPIAEVPELVYYWKDRFPNGFPTTPDQWLAEGARLQKDHLYAMTYFGSTAFGGDGAQRGTWMAIASFGGTYDDGQGHLLLNTPENVAALTWLREMVQKKYVPEVDFAPDFEDEAAFMDSSAAAIPTGLYGYRYMNPLTAPSGKKYSKGTEQDMLDAIAAGDVMLAPMPAPAGKKPGCDVFSAAFFIPVGAKNVDAAHDYINWLMSPAQNPDFVVGPGAGFPVLKSILASSNFQTPFYEEAATAVAASSCRPFQGSLLDTAGAEQAIMNVVYKVVRTSPTSDIAKELQAAQDAYNNSQP